MPLLLALFACTTATPVVETQPRTEPRVAVEAFYAGVDDGSFDPAIDADQLVGFTVDAAGAPMVAEGAAGIAAVRDVIAGWAADGGTITSDVQAVTCHATHTMALCHAQVEQRLTQDGEDAGTYLVRASFGLHWDGAVWRLRHWHESAFPEAPDSPPPVPADGEPDPDDAG